MNIENRYRSYYKELFIVHSCELFYYLTGDNYDEYGDEYNDRYESLYNEFSIDFSNILTTLTMHNIGITESMVELKLVEYMDKLLRKEKESNGVNLDIKRKGLNTLAKLMVHSIKERVGMNSVDHPLRRCV